MLKNHTRSRRGWTDDRGNADAEYDPCPKASELKHHALTLHPAAYLPQLEAHPMAVSKILVADDQPINVQLLKRKLEREGLVLIPAYSGLEAIDLVSREKPDLILHDVMMPDMEGIEAWPRLQAQEETCSIPMMSPAAEPLVF